MCERDVVRRGGRELVCRSVGASVAKAANLSDVCMCCFCLCGVSSLKLIISFS